MFLIQNNYLTQHMPEPTRGENVLDVVLSSQTELLDNVKTHEPLGNSDHNQIHIDIKLKLESKNLKQYRRHFHKGKYKDMRKYLAKLDQNIMLRNKLIEKKCMQTMWGFIGVSERMKSTQIINRHLL